MLAEPNKAREHLFSPLGSVHHHQGHLRRLLPPDGAGRQQSRKSAQRRICRSRSCAGRDAAMRGVPPRDSSRTGHPKECTADRAGNGMECRMPASRRKSKERGRSVRQWCPVPTGTGSNPPLGHRHGTDLARVSHRGNCAAAAYYHILLPFCAQGYNTWIGRPRMGHSANASHPSNVGKNDSIGYTGSVRTYLPNEERV